MIKYFNFPLLILLLTIFVFFKPFFLNDKLPIPADTIIGLYHPFRDLYAKDYPNGIPYKNFLITDPVRQQYPWRFLGIEIEKRGELPLWNPYSMSGTPLAGSLQGAVFYPLNFLLFLLPFSLGWSLLIILQPLLAGIFLYCYLKNLKLSSLASLFGALTFSFCGFSIAWLEWGTLVHIVLWLPLILLSIDKIFFYFGRGNSSKFKVQNAKLQFKIKNYFWLFLFVFSLSSSLLAGHFQFFFYVFLVSFIYFLARWVQYGMSKKIFVIFMILASCFMILTFIQWFPTLQFILQSARDVDQSDWQKAGWFIPLQHLVQFIAPDFFGNPTTLNYWGVWNYGELVGYVGLVPLVMGIFALFFRRDKKTFFFGSLFFLSLIFSLPTFLAELPYLLQLPFLSSSQPTRLLLVIDFSLSVLAALGIDWFINHKNKKQIFFPLLFVGGVLGLLWVVVLLNPEENMLVAKRNLVLPTLTFFSAALVLIMSIFMKNKRVYFGLVMMLVLITIVDLNRFGQKFTPFTNKAYLFPQTKILAFLQKQNCHAELVSASSNLFFEIPKQVRDDSNCDHDQFRIMTTDARILPPNFSAIYHLQSVGGYDPLYLRGYGELIAASERGKPDIHPPFGFNRIINPTNTHSRIIDLLGVKYILSFSELPSPQFTKVLEEGQTKIYKNNQAFPRAFFVANVKVVETKQEAIEALFDDTIDLHKTAIAHVPVGSSGFGQGKAKISSYSENTVVVDTENSSMGFLVLTDSYYPTWKAKVCSTLESSCTELPIFLTDYHFRGVIIPEGNHSIVFYNTLL